MKKLPWILSALATVAIVLFIIYSNSNKKEQGANQIQQPEVIYNPVVSPANFTNSTQLTNPYFPFELDKKYIYEGQTSEGLEHVEVERLSQTKEVLGISCIVVNDKVWVDGKLIEDTDDWYAQDNDGSVWYMGEDVDNLNSDGSLKDHAGSWEAGVDGAKPGFAMLADPKVGKSYRQEYYKNHAEDQAEVIAVNLSVETPLGIFENTIKTKEWTELEPDLLEYKFYAPGIGLIKVEDVTNNEEINLIEIQG